MSVDLNILRLLKHRKNWEAARGVVNHKSVEETTATILKQYGEYFREAGDLLNTIPTGKEFLSWFKLRNPHLSPDAVEVYEKILRGAATEVPATEAKLLMKKLCELDFAQQISEAIVKYNNGEDIDLPALTRRRVDAYERDAGARDEFAYEPVGEELFADDKVNGGFQWRWDCLSRVMRPLRSGDFVIVAARPDQGKTTACADLLTYMAQQLHDPTREDLEKYRGRHIIWLNNEGPGDRIQKRVLQSALGLPMSDLLKLADRGVLFDRYRSLFGGDLHAIKVFNIHAWKAGRVENLLRKYPPALILFDMIDNVRWDGDMTNGGTRTDQMLEAQYQWARELGVRFDCATLATSQTSGDAEGMLFPALGMLKDSKTGKQGAADAIITIGNQVGDGVAEALRGIGLTKNKLTREGQPKSCKARMIIRGDIGRFVEGAIGESND